MPHSTEHGKTYPNITRLMQSSTVINVRWCHIRWCDRNAVDHRRYDVSIVIYLWFNYTVESLCSRVADGIY